MPYISKRVRRERREKEELVENAIIILFMHFTHSMVLTPQQFNAVIMALGEGLIPVNQDRPVLVQTNPIEEMEDLFFESKFRFTKQEVGEMVALMDLPHHIVLPMGVHLLRHNYASGGVVSFSISNNSIVNGNLLWTKSRKLSRIFNNRITYLLEKYKDRLLLDLGLIDGRKNLYCQAIRNMCGELLVHCFGFIDSYFTYEMLQTNYISGGSVQCAQERPWA